MYLVPAAIVIYFIFMDYVVQLPLLKKRTVQRNNQRIENKKCVYLFNKS